MIRIKKYNLVLGLLNARSLNTGQDELLASLDSYKPDVLAINETWIKAGQEKFAPVMPGYIFKHKPRNTGARGGGVGFYVKKGLRVRIKTHPDSPLEQLWLELTLPGRGRIIIGTAYRPESVSVDVAIEGLCESVSTFSYCKHLFILTDFNVDLLQTNKPSAREVFAFLSQHNMEVVVKDPTRVDSRTSSLLDLVITDSPELCTSVNIYHNPALSDHAMVISEFNIEKPKEVPKYTYKRLLDKIDHEQFSNDLKNISWSNIIGLLDIDDQVTKFNEMIINLFNKHAPIKRIKVRTQSTPWITQNIKLMMALRDKALTRAHASKTASHLDYYRGLRNYVTGAIEREKKAYFDFFINNNKDKPKQMWEHLKRTCPFSNNSNSQSTVPHHLNDPNKINKFFLDVPGRDLVDSQTVQYFEQNRFSDDVFDINITTPEEVAKIIYSIKTKASGHDSISIDMIKMTLPSTLPVITEIVNNCLKTKKFPDTWKLAKIKPIPKCSKVEELKDLRPISILPVFSKIVERLVCTQLTKFLEDADILPETQSGFRSGFGTATALASVSEDIIAASDAGMCSALILLDFSRAFDCLNTKLLLAKLSYYGVSDESLPWFRSFLTNRYQYVEIETEQGESLQSDVSHLNKGTPQGSILSPILFIIFTTDLPKQINHCKIHLYADDTQIYYHFKPEHTKTAIEKINEDLNTISDWASKNSLVLNASKTKYMLLGSKVQCNKVESQSFHIKIHSQVLQRVDSAVNLGLIIDKELRFTEHVNSKIRNALYRLKILYNIRKYLSGPIRKTLVESVVLSQFNYCDTVYGPRLYGKTKKAIQRVQNACVRFCHHVPRRAHITPYLNKTDTLKMEARRKIHLSCMVLKIIFNKRPRYLYTKLEWVQDVQERNTRRREGNKLVIPAHRTAQYKGGFKYSATKIWNDLPPPLRKSMSQITLKKHLVRELLNIQKSI